MVAAGELRGDLDIECEADMLAAFADGLCVQALLDPRRYSRARLRAMVDEQLRALALRGARQ
jgi:hypothetical protein